MVPPGRNSSKRGSVSGTYTAPATGIESQRASRIAVEDRWQYDRVELTPPRCPSRAQPALCERGDVSVAIDATAVSAEHCDGGQYSA